MGLNLSGTQFLERVLLEQGNDVMNLRREIGACLSSVMLVPIALCGCPVLCIGAESEMKEAIRTRREHLLANFPLPTNSQNHVWLKRFLLDVEKNENRSAE